MARFAERDQLLHDRAQVLGFGQRRRDLLVLDQRGGKICQHRAAMIRTPVELAVRFAVIHLPNYS
jgi:hypothetical protein